MYLEAIIKFNSEESVVKIPRKAFYDSQKIYTIRKEDSTLKSISVQVRSSDDEYIYAANIDDSVLYVSQPIINAKENSKVYPIIK